MNRPQRGIVVVAALLTGVAWSASSAVARADAACQAGAPAGFGFGNAGFGAGYSMSVGGGGWVGRGCGPRIDCRPRWSGWCNDSWRSRCWTPGWRSHCWNPCWNPCWNAGWNPCWGGTVWGFNESIFFSIPAGGGLTFFSGSLVPYPVMGNGFGWWPWFGAAGGPAAGRAGLVTARAGVVPRIQPAPPVERAVIAVAPRAAGRAAAIRASTPASRRRAATLAARGDEQFRAAGRDQPARLEAALASYRQAASAAADQPDIFIRQAIVLVALDRPDLADLAVAQAVAVDGRLGASAEPADVATVTDPVFGGRAAGGVPPLAARGAAILREIGTGMDGEAGPAGMIAWLGDRWAARFGRGVNAVAANDR